MEAYFDESLDGTTSVIAVAGYLFEPDYAKRLDEQWKDLLHQHGLEFFHMTDCATNAPPYDALGPEKCDLLARALIKGIREHMYFQVAASIELEQFDRLAGLASEQIHTDFRKMFGGPYTAALMYCLSEIGAFARGHGWKISYFFERGYKDESEAEFAMGLVRRDAHVLQKCCYGSHTFADKRDVRLLQAADILAWQWSIDWANQFGGRGRPRRRDLAALLKDRLTSVKHFRVNDLEKYFNDTLEYHYKQHGRFT